MIFPKEIRFGLEEGCKADGYISDKGIKLKKGLLYPMDGYIAGNKLCIPTKLNEYTRIWNTEITVPFKGIKREDYSEVRHVYKYAMMANRTAIPVYSCVTSKIGLIGFAFPSPGTNAAIHFVSTMEPGVVDGYDKYIKICLNKKFPDIPTVITGNENLGSTFYTGVLYAKHKPVLATYINMANIKFSWVCEWLSNELMTSYVCNYASSLLNNDEILVVNENHCLSGFSVDTKTIRKICPCSPIIMSSKIIRQPYIHLDDQYLYMYIPCAADGPASMYIGRKARTKDKEDDIFAFVLDIAEKISNSEYSREKIPYTQIQGYNNIIEFPDGKLARELLNGLEA